MAIAVENGQVKTVLCLPWMSEMYSNEYQSCAIEKIKTTPACVLLLGPSIGHLVDCIERARNADLLYFTVNQTEAVEEKILSRIDRVVDVWQINCTVEIKRQAKRVIKFLQDDRSLLFITTSEALSKIADILDMHKSAIPFHKIYLIDQIHYNMCKIIDNDYNPAWWGRINSKGFMLGFLGLLEVLHPVYLFGCDGAAAGDDKIYFEQAAMRPERVLRNGILSDMLTFERVWPSIVSQLFEQRGIPVPRIINVNPSSHYNSFEKMSVEQWVDRIQTATGIFGRHGSAPVVSRVDDLKIYEFLLHGIKYHQLHKTSGDYFAKLDRALDGVNARLDAIERKVFDAANGKRERPEGRVSSAIQAGGSGGEWRKNGSASSGGFRSHVLTCLRSRWSRCREMIGRYISRR